MKLMAEWNQLRSNYGSGELGLARSIRDPHLSNTDALRSNSSGTEFLGLHRCFKFLNDFAILVDA